MGDQVLQVPMQSDAKSEAWKKASAELSKMQSQKRGGGVSSIGNNNTGQNMWMPHPFSFPSANPALAYGSFAGGFHPSAWDGQPMNIPPPPPPSAAGANAAAQAAYNQTSYNYQPAIPQQNRNGYGRGRGGGAGNWNQQTPQKTANFQPFSLNTKNNQGAYQHLSKSFVPSGGGGGGPQPLMGIGRGRGIAPQGVVQPAGPKPTPPSAQRYMERAYEAANTPEERKKTEEYLKKRLHPMLNAGNAHMVNWDNEPLPHEKNYEFSSWTPAKQLPYQANGLHRKKSPQRRRSDEMSNGGDSKPKRARRESDPSSGSDDSDQIEILHFSTSNQQVLKGKRGVLGHEIVNNLSQSSNTFEKSFLTPQNVQKKTKAQRKAEKAAKKNLKKQKQQQQQKSKNSWKVEGIDTDARREDRARRFAESLSASKPATNVVPQHYFRRGQVIRGTCQNIEKAFFRLTAAPEPSAVRPLEILKLSLDNVRTKYRQRVEYAYLTSQLRSIRQDLTVQRIRNEFTVEVYEINARISLENADREEFNKCQSQLKLLYSEVEGCKNRAEFVSYRLLYYIAMENQIDINSLLQELTPELKEDECVKFALKVRKAVSMTNYVHFFKLFKNAPRMCPFIMDMFADRERKKAVGIIQKAFRPTMSYKLMSEFLNMGENELVGWLQEELKWTDARVGASFDCKIPRNCS